VTLRVVRMVEERFHRDAEDRPIREGRTPPEFLREGDIEYRTCPYSGSRYQHAHPMNASALRQTGQHWDAILSALARLRALHDRMRNVTEPQLMDIWRVTQLGSSLPWFFIFRDMPVPAYAAALSKASLGMGIWAQRVFVRVLTEGWQPPVWTAENVLEVAEASGTLIGETEVCSGGDKMLLKYFDVHVTRQPTTGELHIDGARDVDVLRFGAHYTNFKLALWIYFLARRFLYADVGAADFLEHGVEPSDFFLVEPSDLAAVSPEQRMGWLRSLADLVQPFAPDASDLQIRDHVFAMATAMGKGASPAATWRMLDDSFGRIVALVEVGLRGSGEPGAIDVPPAIRDRLIGASPRAMFDRIP